MSSRPVSSRQLGLPCCGLVAVLVCASFAQLLQQRHTSFAFIDESETVTEGLSDSLELKSFDLGAVFPQSDKSSPAGYAERVAEVAADAAAALNDAHLLRGPPRI